MRAREDKGRDRGTLFRRRSRSAGVGIAVPLNQLGSQGRKSEKERTS